MPYLAAQIQLSVCIVFTTLSQPLFYKHFQRYIQLLQTNKLSCSGLAETTQLLYFETIAITNSEEKNNSSQSSMKGYPSVIEYCRAGLVHFLTMTI